MSETRAKVISHVQHFGILAKRPIGHEASNWSKRFFVIKDGFLLYYAESDQKVFNKQRSINLHPKGIFPLGGSTIEAIDDSDHPFMITVAVAQNDVKLHLAAETESERNVWIRAIEQSSRITWENAQLSDAMIQQLERQGRQLANEKQVCLEKIRTENEQSKIHRERAEELEQVIKELEQEKVEWQKLTADIKAEFESTSSKLEQKTAEVLQLQETERQLSESSGKLQQLLETLQAEKIQVSSDLQRQRNNVDEMSRDKQELSKEAQALHNRLNEIEAKMTTLTQEKSVALEKMRLHEEQTRKLLSEKEQISTHADKLKLSLKELSDQKAMTDVILREEIQARLQAERRLLDAEQSLARIEASIKQSNVSSQAEYDRVMVDVKNLKDFFENVAFESKLDAKKGDMIKESLQSRKAVRRRVKTTLFDENTKSQFQNILRQPSRNSSSSVSSPLSPSQSRDGFQFTLPTSPAPASDKDSAFNKPGSRHSCLELLQHLSHQF